MNEILSIAQKPLLFPGLEEMCGYTVRATDGDVGHVHDWYFDDADWEVRYLVVDNGHWLPGRRVLISPSVCGVPDPREKVLPVALRRARIESSPEWDQRLPVSRQHLEALHQHYGWPGAWPLSAMAGTGVLPGTMPMPPAEEGEARRAEEAGAETRSPDAHLRSVSEVTGYAIHATDGEIGHASDLLCGRDPWRIRYLVASTRRWWPGHEVLLPVGSVREIDWASGQVRVGLNRDRIRHSPPYEPNKPVGRDFESELHEHYEMIAYWQSRRGGRP